MKIIHVVDSMEMGGMEKLVALLCRRQREQGHVASVQCLYRVGILGEELCADGFEVACCKTETERRSRHLHWALAQHRPDVVHCHNATATILGAFPARRAGAQSVIATRHGVVDPPYALRRELKFSFASRWCDWIVAVCERARDNLQAAPFAARHKVVRIYNGASLSPQNSAWQPTNSGFTFVHVGRLSAAKDQATLLLAFALALLHIADLKLWIVGEGPLRPQLERMVGELGITGHVHFFGEQPSVAPFLAAADAFVLSSVTEGLPVSLIEAMAAGLPAVVTNVGGIQEVARLTEAVIAVPPHNSLALASALEKMHRSAMTNPELRVLARECHERYFTVERMANRYMSLYTSKHSDWDSQDADAEIAGEVTSNVVAARMAG